MSGARGLRPTSFLGINRDSHLATGLVGFFEAQRQDTLIEHVGRNSASALGATAAHQIFGSYHKSWQFTNATTRLLDFSSGDFTVASWVYTPAAITATYWDIFGKSTYVNESNNQGWVLQVRPSGNFFFLVFTNTGSGDYLLDSTVAAGGLQHIVGRVSSADDFRSIWVNGVQVATKGNTVGRATCSAVVASTANSGVEPAYGLMGMAWNRALNNSEIWSLYDPATRWDLYAMPAKRYFIFNSNLIPINVGHRPYPFRPGVPR